MPGEGRSLSAASPSRIPRPCRSAPAPPSHLRSLSLCRSAFLAAPLRSLSLCRSACHLSASRYLCLCPCPCLCLCLCASAYARGPSCCTVYGGRFDWRSPLAVPVHVQISIIGPARPAHRTRARQSFSTSSLSTSAHESASWDLSEDRSRPRPASSVYCANCLPENRVTTHRAVDSAPRIPNEWRLTSLK